MFCFYMSECFVAVTVVAYQFVCYFEKDSVCYVPLKNLLSPQSLQSRVEAHQQWQHINLSVSLRTLQYKCMARIVGYRNFFRKSFKCWVEVQLQ